MRASKPFLTAEWRNLVMLNYVIEPERLAAFVPAGVEIDTWDGQTLFSLVGFQFLDTRVRGLAVPGLRNFDEVNLRIYVRRRAEDGWRRGVVFIREIVPNRAISWVANALYQEHYVALPMRHEISSRGARYEWQCGGEWFGLGAILNVGGDLPAAGTQDEFVTEHYWGYVRRRHGDSLEYGVEHPRWRVWTASEVWREGRLDSFYPVEFAESLRRPPVSAFVAEGSPVTVFQGSQIA